MAIEGRELCEIRIGQGLSKQEFVSCVQPFIRNFHLDVRILEKIENGSIKNKERLRELQKAATKAFDLPPEASAVVRRRLKIGIPWKWLVIASIFIAIIAFAAAFMLIESEKTLDRIERLLEVFATVATIVTFLIGLRLWNKSGK